MKNKKENKIKNNSIKYIKSMNQKEFDKELNDGHIDEAYLKLIKAYIEIKLFSKAKELIKERKKVDEKNGLKSYKDKYINMEKDIE